MADSDRSGRSGGGRKGEDGTDPLKRQMSRGKALMNALLDVGPTDTFGEVLADSAINKQADKLGVRFAEHFLKMPATRALLLVAPATVLEYVGPAAANFVVLRWTDHERPRAWASEFAEGFTRRIREAQEGKGVTGSVASAAAGTRPAPPVPAGPREMTAAEILDKKPELLREVVRLYPIAADRELVIARLHRTLNYEYEADLLLTAMTTATPYDSLVATQSFVDLTTLLGVLYTDAKELERVTAELRKRVGGLPHLTDLIRPLPVPAVAPPTPAPTATPQERMRGLIAAHPTLVQLLERLYPATGERLAVLQRLLPVATNDGVAMLIRDPEDPKRVPAGLRASADFVRLSDLIDLHAESPAEEASWRKLLEERLRTDVQLQQLLPADAGADNRGGLAARLQVLPLPSPQLDRAHFESRIDMLERLTAPAAPATTMGIPATTRPPTKAEFEARLMALPPVPRQGMDRETFEQMLVLIEDSQSSRFMGPLKAGVDRINMIGRQVFGGTDRIGTLLDEGATFFVDLETNLFDPPQQPAVQQAPQGLIASFFAPILNLFRRTPPAQPQQQNNQGGTP